MMEVVRHRTEFRTEHLSSQTCSSLHTIPFPRTNQIEATMELRSVFGQPRTFDLIRLSALFTTGSCFSRVHWVDATKSPLLTGRNPSTMPSLLWMFEHKVLICGFKPVPVQLILGKRWMAFNYPSFFASKEFKLWNIINEDKGKRG